MGVDGEVVEAAYDDGAGAVVDAPYDADEVPDPGAVVTVGDVVYAVRLWKSLHAVLWGSC